MRDTSQSDQTQLRVQELQDRYMLWILNVFPVYMAMQNF